MWSTREIEVILMFIGQMTCEMFNFGLKRLIREERPQRTWTSNCWRRSWLVAEMHGKGYGMPSSHSQFVAYFAVSLSLFLLVRHQDHPHPAATATNTKPSSTQHPSQSWSLRSLSSRIFLSVTTILTALSVAASRVYLMYHTPKQVLVGVAAGITFALIWFLFTSSLRTAGWLDWVLNFEMVKWFRIRDLVIYEDIWDAGWVRFEDRRRFLKDKKTKRSWMRELHNSPYQLTRTTMIIVRCSESTKSSQIQAVQPIYFTNLYIVDQNVSEISALRKDSEYRWSIATRVTEILSRCVKCDHW